MNTLKKELKHLSLDDQKKDEDVIRLARVSLEDIQPVQYRRCRVHAYISPLEAKDPFETYTVYRFALPRVQ
jgi:DNA-binding GntR family transcriptional regulator